MADAVGVDRKAPDFDEFCAQVRELLERGEPPVVDGRTVAARLVTTGGPSGTGLSFAPAERRSIAAYVARKAEARRETAKGPGWLDKLEVSTRINMNVATPVFVSEWRRMIAEFVDHGRATIAGKPAAFRPCRGRSRSEVYCLHEDHVKAFREAVRPPLPASGDCHLRLWQLRYKSSGLRSVIAGIGMFWNKAVAAADAGDLSLVEDAGMLLTRSRRRSRGDWSIRSDGVERLVAAARASLGDAFPLPPVPRPRKKPSRYLKQSFDAADRTSRTTFAEAMSRMRAERKEPRFGTDAKARIAAAVASRRSADLREHQSEATGAIAAHFAGGANVALVTIPTAGGKTRIFQNIVAGLPEVGPNGIRSPNVVVLVPTRTLIRQTWIEFRRQFGVTAASASWGDLADDGDGTIPRGVAPVTLMTYAGFMESVDLGLLRPDDIDLLVMDEAHRGLSRLRQAALMPYLETCMVTAFTATPAFDGRKSLLRMLGAENRVYSISSAELRRRWVISPLVNYVLSISLQGEAPDDAGLARAKRRALVEGVLDFVENHVDDVGGALSGKIALFYGADRAHARMFAESYNARFEGRKRMEVLTGDDPSWRVKEVLDLVKAGAVTAISNSLLLGEGFDFPQIGLVINAPSDSMLKIMQQGGRAQRIDPDIPLTEEAQTSFVIDTYYRVNGVTAGRPRFLFEALDDPSLLRLVDAPPMDFDRMPSDGDAAVEEEETDFLSDSEDAPDFSDAAHPETPRIGYAAEIVSIVRMAHGRGAPASYAIEEGPVAVSRLLDGRGPKRKRSRAAKRLSRKERRAAAYAAEAARLSAIEAATGVAVATDELTHGRFCRLVGIGEASSRIKRVFEELERTWVATGLAEYGGETFVGGIYMSPSGWNKRGFCIARSEAPRLAKLLGYRLGGTPEIGDRLTLPMTAAALGVSQSRVAGFWSGLLRATQNGEPLHLADGPLDAAFTKDGRKRSKPRLSVDPADLPRIRAHLGIDPDLPEAPAGYLTRVHVAAALGMTTNATFVSAWNELVAAFDEGRLDGIRAMRIRKKHVSSNFGLHRDDIAAFARAFGGGRLLKPPKRTDADLTASEVCRSIGTSYARHVRYFAAVFEGAARGRSSVVGGGSVLPVLKSGRKGGRPVWCFSASDVDAFRKQFGADLPVRTADDVPLREAIKALGQRARRSGVIPKIRTACASAWGRGKGAVVNGRTLRGRLVRQNGKSLLCISRSSIEDLAAAAGIPAKTERRG